MYGKSDCCILNVYVRWELSDRKPALIQPQYITKLELAKRNTKKIHSKTFIREKKNYPIKYFVNVLLYNCGNHLILKTSDLKIPKIMILDLLTHSSITTPKTSLQCY